MTDKPRGRLPWSLADLEDAFEIRDADNRPLYLIRLYRREPPVPNPLDLMSWDEALRLARAMFELPELRKLAAARQETRESWAAALRMIREAVETLGPPGTLPSQDAVLERYGPEPVHEATAIVEALQKLLTRA